jgi:HTH-type transcriptional regulator/antitoxin HigA
MKLKVIKHQKDYAVALKRFETIFNAEKGAPEYDEAGILSLLLKNYEDEHFHVPAPDPIIAIKIAMENSGYNAMTLSKKSAIGKSTISDILHKRRALNVKHIRQFHRILGISTDTLFSEYELEC